MLRITLIRESQPPTLKLEGKLSGPWVNELEHTWSEISQPDPERTAVVIDLSDVTFISSEGRKLLKSMFRQGANLQSRSLMTQFILGQIKKASNGYCATENGG